MMLNQIALRMCQGVWARWIVRVFKFVMVRFSFHLLTRILLCGMVRTGLIK